jgi:hypothetical protein
MSRRQRQSRPQPDETEEGNPPTPLTHLFERYRLRLSRNRALVRHALVTDERQPVISETAVHMG